MNHHPEVTRQRMKAMRAEAKRLGHRLTPFYSGAYDGILSSTRHACCLDCGGRVSLSGDLDPDPELDALTFPCRAKGNGLRALESQAWLTKLSPRLLLRRFKRALEEEVPPHIRRFFDPGEFDPFGGFLRSDDQVWRLEWILREDPYMPIDEENPQSREGLVKLQRMVAEHRMTPARYIGPHLNPNISRDKNLWEVVPLEPGTLGWIYFSHEGEEDQFGHTPLQGRFRRPNGTTGYAITGGKNNYDFELSDKERHIIEASQIPTPEEAEVQDPEVIAAIRAANGEADWFE